MVMKNNYGLLTTDEMIKYKTLKQEGPPFYITIFLFPFYFLFWGTIFAILFALAFSINISVLIIQIFGALCGVWPWAIVMYLSMLIINYTFIARRNMMLIDKILSERTYLKRKKIKIHGRK